MKRNGFVLIWIAVSLAVLLGCSDAVQDTTTETELSTTAEASVQPQSIVETDVVELQVTELVVSSPEEMPDLETLATMTSLRRIDLTGLSDTPYETIAELSRVLLDCEILWNQKLTDGIFRSDSTALTLPNATVGDIDLLDAFEKLTYVDATGSTAYETLAAYAAAHPQITVLYAFQDGTFIVSSADESAEVPAGIDAAAFSGAVPFFPNLKTVDLRASGWTDAELDAFCEINPSVSVARTVLLGEERVDTETTALNLRDLTGWTADDLIAKLRAFPNLEIVALPSDWTQQDIDTFSTAFPNVRMPGKTEAFGKTFDEGAMEIDLSKIKMDSDAEVRELLSHLPFLQTADMCDCGLSDEQMDALRADFPTVKFVWIIHIGSRRLRTDAIGFSTKNPSKYTNSNASDEYNQSVKTAERLKEGDIEALKYCTDLEALDLGHNYLTNNDLNVISGLTKLKILILADNKITDISALTTLKDLEYIELFMNEIPDLSPLTELPNLVDVNVCKVGVSDLTPLYSLTGVKRLWYALNPVSREEAKKLADALPDCLCNYTAKSSTEGGWREDPRYRWMRSFFD